MLNNLFYVVRPILTKNLSKLLTILYDNATSMTVAKGVRIGKSFLIAMKNAINCVPGTF